MWKRAGIAMAIALTAGIIFGCAPKQPPAAAATEHKTYVLTPDTVKVKAGPVSGEFSQLQVAAEYNKVTGEVVSTPQLAGTLTLKNSSPDQVVQMISGKIRFLDVQGQALKLSTDAVDAVIPVSGYDAKQLVPGQSTTQSVTVDFPAAVLEAKSMKELALELSYETFPYKDQTLRYQVAIGDGKQG